MGGLGYNGKEWASAEGSNRAFREDSEGSEQILGHNGAQVFTEPVKTPSISPQFNYVTRTTPRRKVTSARGDSAQPDLHLNISFVIPNNTQHLEGNERS